ncbi:DUF2844 domain-containing protein [Burkholderia sp. Se-20373]|uniref:DUF2844 domain-containing protein n=1 Tax=Burkholderia sp. Se-20373 TaxID=2703898 RepID=UPI00197F376C|nr:DUF2844 domain-containing protein [Burkholderia sp. Se-20373]MBN3744417.1 DUF2844 domain-containing protein [Burkholderia sp. Se-20373]
MKKRISILAGFISLSAILFALSSPVRAELGAAPRLPASGETYSTTNNSSYSVRQTNLIGGTVLREYIDQYNTVFAVAWDGPNVPDLASLFGIYFNEYQKALQDYQAACEQSNYRSCPRGVVNLQLSDFVSHQGGHMRSFYGQAWLTDYLPTGVQPSAIW